MRAITINLSRQEYNKENLIGARVQLSLKPFIQYIERKILTEKTARINLYKYILNQFYKYPELEEPIAEADTHKYSALFELVYICLSPILTEENEQLWAIGTPLSPAFFFGTTGFYSILLDPVSHQLREGLKLGGRQEMERTLKTSFYNLLLKRFYNFSLSDSQFTITSLIDPDTHLLKHYRLNIDMRFLEIYNHGTLPELKIQNLRTRLQDESNTLDLLCRLLPIEQFSIEGISIVNLIDVTAEYAIESIKNVIIEHNECSIGSYNQKVATALKTIAGSDHIQFGLLPYLQVNSKTVINARSGFESILLQLVRKESITDYHHLLDEYLKNPRRLVFPEIVEREKEKFPMLKILDSNGIKSYALVPLFYNGKFAGCLEVYATDSNLFSIHNLSKLEPALPLLAQLLENIVTEFKNEISNIITDKFTSIQPAVQWRFNEAAYHYLLSTTESDKPVLEKIKFKQVQPFYGAIDIKDSSVQRNLAIRKDLNNHFDLLDKTLEALTEISPVSIKLNMPSDGLICAYKEHAQLSDAQILKIEDYLLRQIPPYFEMLSQTKPKLRETIGHYFSLCGPNGKVYANRLQYESSMQTLNRKINAMLDAFNNELQGVYPCYFEKFRTDGVEFDIYVGQSIAPEIPMPDHLIHNFRLLQLETIARIAQSSHALIPELSNPLETTQLIFVHEKTIDINFRPDEQRFDVEGSYNIRYQLVKKRIDKAHIKDSAERLTQPGKIAIVYLNSWEAQEYLGYIKALQSQKLLNDDVEYVEIEELQGVDGLKALRVGVQLG